MLDYMGSPHWRMLLETLCITDGKRIFWFPNGRFSCVFEIAGFPVCLR
jgi:hypothetical protein